MAFDPNEARDEHGRWTAGGTAGGHDERVLDVGGDAWNKETAARLEKEYEAHRADINELAQKAVVDDVKIEAPAGSWEDMPSDLQQTAEEKFIEKNFSNELDHEIENWHESDGSLYDASHQLAKDNDWKAEQLAELIKDRDESSEPRIPYSPDDLLAAITIEPGDEGGKDPKIDFDDSKLQHPDNHMSPDQLSLPGIDAPKPEDSLTEAMRKDITTYLTEQFNSKADDMKSDMEAPEYLTDQAKESLGSMWDEWGDEEKYDWVKKNTDLVDEDGEHVAAGVIVWPGKFDPLNETTGANYSATQKMARYLQTELSAQTMFDRGIAKQAQADSLKEDIKVTNGKLWQGWKDSSAGNEGKLIQVAAHEELGGRLNTSSRGVDVQESIDYANRNYKAVGGYDGVKAIIRGTWEATQYMLDRAEKPIVGVYRGIKIEDLKFTTGEGYYKLASDGSKTPVSVEKVEAPGAPGKYKYGDVTTEYERLPNLHVARNGASSWTTDPKVANNWSGGSGRRVTLRAEVPRTSVLSVPAYGINVANEHEVVVMGTAWKGWDAWASEAPTFKDVPHVSASKFRNRPTKAEKEHVA